MMTTEELHSKALKVYPVVHDDTDPDYKKIDIYYQNREDYIAGANAILQSIEYQQMVRDALSWREYQKAKHYRSSYEEDGGHDPCYG